MVVLLYLVNVINGVPIIRSFRRCTVFSYQDNIAILLKTFYFLERKISRDTVHIGINYRNKLYYDTENYL